MLTVPSIARILAHHEPRVLQGQSFAAVAIVLVGEEDPGVLLIRRADHPDDPWSGHMAFPGGRRSDQDPDLLATAIREVDEELAIALPRESLVGRIDDLHAISRGRRTEMVIRPYVFALAEVPKIAPDPKEVAAVYWAKTSHLFNPAAAAFHDYEHAGNRFRLPAVNVDGNLVWGLTYQMLQSFLSAVKGG